MGSQVLPLLFLTVLITDIAGDTTTDMNVEAGMETEELLGLFEVVGALLEDPYWTQMHPHPCTDTPWPGIQCGVDPQNPQIFHVTKLHIGPEVAASPCCKASANLSESLLKLPFLKTLSIFNCFLTSGISLSPSLFGSLSSLEQIVIKSNPGLGGEIPPTIADIATLRVLCLSQNSLQGGIPKGFGELEELEQLDLSYNHLTGEIPEEIGQKLKSLTILDLGYNNFQGEVPSSLGQLVSVQKIDLSSNSFVGRVPKEMGELKNLVLLDFSHNTLQGPIPDNLSGLKGLQYFLLDDNPINTKLPFSLGKLCSLTVLSLSGCGLLGPIPTSFAGLEHLSALNLDRNRLSGPIPASLGTIPNLGQLNLSQNQLSGEVFFTDGVVERLGKRLDVRGNSGLCRGHHQLHKKFSDQYLDIPVCLGSSNQSDRENSQFEKLKPNWVGGKESSSAQSLMGRLVFLLCCNLFVILI